jgi:hypothetical protein
MAFLDKFTDSLRHIERCRTCSSLVSHLMTTGGSLKTENTAHDMVTSDRWRINVFKSLGIEYGRIKQDRYQRRHDRQNLIPLFLQAFETSGLSVLKAPEDDSRAWTLRIALCSALVKSTWKSGREILCTVVYWLVAVRPF